MAESTFLRRFRFRLQTVIWLNLFIGLLLAWSISSQRMRQRVAQQQGQLTYAEAELERARNALAEQEQALQELAQGNRIQALWEADLDGANLSGATIITDGNAFQRASFKDCDLSDVLLTGGGADFQFARFDAANLENAQLTGGAASFQGATFVGADLTGATLVGGGASFQTASFENALLVGARLSGNFQLVNLSGTRFESADLSALNAAHLESCYFKVPPTYNGETRFPTGFDPQVQGWRLSHDRPQSK